MNPREYLRFTHMLEMGETVSQIPRTTQANYGQIPWPQIIGMRNRLIHGYDEVNLDLVWHTATGHIPIMVTLLREILDALPPLDPEAGETTAD